MVLAAVLEIAHGARNHPRKLGVHRQVRVVVHHVSDQLRQGKRQRCVFWREDMRPPAAGQHRSASQWSHLHLRLQVVLPDLPHAKCVPRRGLPGEGAVCGGHHGRPGGCSVSVAMSTTVQATQGARRVNPKVAERRGSLQMCLQDPCTCLGSTAHGSPCFCRATTAAALRGTTSSAGGDQGPSSRHSSTAGVSRHAAGMI